MSDEEDDNFYMICVEVPKGLSLEIYDKIFDAVADAAYEAQPEDRDWDVFVHGIGPARP